MSEHWQQRLHSLAGELGIVGASLAIHHGDDRAEAAYGVLNLNTGAPVRTDSLFQLGSITKVYTTTVALRLVDAGKLDLDAPITEVLPDLLLTDPDALARVSLRHLLTHTSGIDGDVFTDTGRGDDCLARYTDGLAEVAQLHPIDATWSYCNTGFVLVGRMIERVTGLVWDEAMRQLLFDPLGLTATVTLPEEVLRFGAALGHVRTEDDELEPARRWGLPRSSGPAGLIVASAREVLEFARMHLRGGVSADGTRILSERLAEQMRAKQVTLPPGVGMAESWGLGWSRHDWHGHPVIGHNGTMIGQAAFLRVSPEHDLAVSLLTNGGPAKDLYDALYREVFAELAGIELPAPDQPPSEPPAVDVAALTGVYERAKLRLEVFDDDGTLRVRMIDTDPLTDREPPEVVELVPESPGRFLTRLPGERRWTPIVFHRLADGSPYVHCGSRAVPKTS